VFLYPTVIQLSHHHHDEFVCKAKNTTHLHEKQEKCLICSFEFSIFNIDFVFHKSENQTVESVFENKYTNPFVLSSFAQYSFLLRGPPFTFS